MIRIKFIRIFVLVIASFFIECGNFILPEEFENDVPGNYNAFWSEFDRYYGAMEAKHINWDSLYHFYGAHLSKSSSNKELFSALSGLLNELNDGHASLYCNDFGTFRSSHKRDRSFFSDYTTWDPECVIKMQRLIRTKYIRSDYQAEVINGWLFFSGIIIENSHQIGYVLIPTFGNESFPMEYIRRVVKSFINVESIIIDLRFNGGGSTEPFVKTMNLFSTERKLFLKSKFRNGPSHKDFTPFFDHYTEPNSESIKNKPLVILMNSFTGSSSEHFILGLKSQPNTITVGDTSVGAFSAVVDRILPNGWHYRIGAQVIYKPNGELFTDSKGNYIEGTGIPPDFYVQDKLHSIENAIDEPLEFAIDILMQ